jgi:membrane protein YdbS with pleckstrin-like domain
VLEPEVKRRNRYIITPNEVMAIEKGWMYEEKTVLPYKSITDVKIRQGFWGKLFEFGDLELSTPKYSIKMFGVKRVEELCEEVKKKISKMA